MGGTAPVRVAHSLCRRSSVCCVGLGRVRQADELHAPAQIVEHHHVLGHHEHHVRRAQRVRRRAVGQALFHIAHAVIAEIAHQTAIEARQLVQVGYPVALLKRFHERQRVVAGEGFHDLAVGGHRDVMAADPNHRAARQADDGVAAPFLAAVGGLQQIGVGALGQLQISGQGRVQVRQGLHHHGDAVVAQRRQLGEAFRAQWFGGRFGHDDGVPASNNSRNEVMTASAPSS